jgi:HSP20 family molecular chaperone IbpA
MRRGRIVDEALLQSIDVANTLSGGISEPMMKLSQHLEYFQIELRVPGIAEENMHVKINNNQLIVFFERKIESRGSIVSVPYIVYNQPIPYFIDASNIRAQYEDAVLVVRLPFNELANGYQRDVPIGN